MRGWIFEVEQGAEVGPCGRPKCGFLKAHWSDGGRKLKLAKVEGMLKKILQG